MVFDPLLLLIGPMIGGRTVRARVSDVSKVKLNQC
jgi:hypothetical protein